MIVDHLERITNDVRRALAQGYYRGFADTREPVRKAPSLAAAVRRDAPWAFLAEVKPSSPSAGDLSSGNAPAKAADQLALYRAYGVTAVSVLTERDSFGGSLDLLSRAVQGGAGTVPVLMKDFIVHPDQLDAAAAAGASAVLLLHHLLSGTHAAWGPKEAIAAAHARGLEVLYEVDSGAALDAALSLDADVLGVNNRNLRTLEMDKDRAPDLLRHRMPKLAGRPVVALSGIETRADVEAMEQGGAAGVLVGTSLMAAADPRAHLRKLRGLVHVKCCGSGHPADGPLVVDALSGADAVGCVVAAGGARRERSPKEAERLFAALPPGVERVVVTPTQDAAALAAIARQAGATHLQLHSDLEPSQLAKVRAGVPSSVHLIALLRLPADGDVRDADARTYAERGRAMLAHADRLLIDVVPRVGEEGGGLGRLVDLALAKRVVDALRPAPVVLGGGLQPDTVASVVKSVRPWGVDVSSGIEPAGVKGRKDPERIRAFLSAARSVRNIHDPPEEPRLRVL